MRAIFEQTPEFLALAAREAREDAQRLLARLEILISGLAAKDANAGLDLRRAAVEFLATSGDHPALRGDGRLSVVAPCARTGAWIGARIGARIAGPKNSANPRCSYWRSWRARRAGCTSTPFSNCWANWVWKLQKEIFL